MRRLPHLNGIRAFEAAARTGSFAAAAAELNISPAAISRMARLFEKRLVVALFEREANRFTLTVAGRAYHIGLVPILDALAQLTDQVQPASRVLTIGVGPTFANRWLIPRLSAFRPLAPDIEVRLTTGGTAAPFADNWSCGIKLGDGHWPGLVAELLFGADLIPGCAPPLARRPKKPGDLHSGVLLRVAHARADRPLWLKAVGVNNVSAKGPMFEYYGQALQRRVTDSASRSAFVPTLTTTSRRAGSLCRSNCPCRKAATGI